MNTLLLTIHVIACVSLVLLVLVQSGHEGMGVIFGGSSGSSFFGSSGAGGVLSKLTIAMAVIFFLTSLSFTYLEGQRSKTETRSVVVEEPAQSGPPAQPAPNSPE